MGDGFLVTFDGPSRAVHCAETIVRENQSLGIEVRAGLHIGEIELDGDDVAGIAVAIGARVAAIAGPSEVLVSQTIKDLTAGSGIAFVDRGEHQLKGVPDRWRLYQAGQLDPPGELEKPELPNAVMPQRMRPSASGAGRSPRWR